MSDLVAYGLMLLSELTLLEALFSAAMGVIAFMVLYISHLHKVLEVAEDQRYYWKSKYYLLKGVCNVRKF